VVIVQDKARRFFPVPYDFDLSGMVHPPYAAPDPRLFQRSATERLYRGPCRTVEAFNRDYKAYGECVRKYVDETKTWIKNIADASNKAIDEFNKYNEEVKKKVEEDKD